jgi:hypothetical protein
MIVLALLIIVFLIPYDSLMMVQNMDGGLEKTAYLNYARINTFKSTIKPMVLMIKLILLSLKIIKHI